MSKTPDDFYRAYNGKAIDIDHGYGVQCVDGFKVFCKWTYGSDYPTGNGWADGYWYSRDAHKGQFHAVGVRELRDGDWVIWGRGSRSHPSSHIAMYYHGMAFGQNQGGNRAFCLKSTNFGDALGALRWKGFSEPSKATPTKATSTNASALKVAHGYNKAYNRVYKTTVRLNIREGHSASCKSLGVLPKGATFRCYGYFDGDWLYGSSTVGNRHYTGFCYKEYLR